jgi:alpha-mannosidase
VVFNALGFDREIPVTAILDADYVEDAEHNPVPCQIVAASRHAFQDRGDTRFLAKVPALGYALFWMTREKYNPPAFPDTGVRGSETGWGALCIENSNLRVEFCAKTGGIAKLIDKRSNRVVNSETMAIPTVIDDAKSDTWAHHIFKFHDIKGTMRLERIRLTEAGPVRACVEVKHTFGNSYLIQKFSVEAGQSKIVIEAKAMWNEPLTMLKLPLPLAGTEEISTYEIPNGFIKRPCGGDEEPGLSWADLTVTDANGKRHGVAVMSDSKYSYDLSRYAAAPDRPAQHRLCRRARPAVRPGAELHRRGLAALHLGDLPPRGRGRAERCHPRGRLPEQPGRRAGGKLSPRRAARTDEFGANQRAEHPHDGLQAVRGRLRRPDRALL